jgi:hypothetical protein
MNYDPLASLENQTPTSEQLLQKYNIRTMAILNLPQESRGHSNLRAVKNPKKVGAIEFVVKYIATATLLFVILVVTSNYKAYWAFFENVFQPQALEGTKTEMLQAVSQTQIKVYAESNTLSGEHQAEQIETIKQQLAADQEEIQENPYSAKRLIAGNPSISTTIEVVPYENRIIIPKIGKNIPLVDVHL